MINSIFESLGLFGGVDVSVCLGAFLLVANGIVHVPPPLFYFGVAALLELNQTNESARIS